MYDEIDMNHSHNQGFKTGILFGIVIGSSVTFMLGLLWLFN